MEHERIEVTCFDDGGLFLQTTYQCLLVPLVSLCLFPLIRYQCRGLHHARVGAPLPANKEWDRIDDVRLLLARAFLRQFSKEDAEQILKHIPVKSDSYKRAKELLANIQKDSDGDGWCDAIEMEWGSDPHDPESIPRKWVK